MFVELHRGARGVACALDRGRTGRGQPRRAVSLRRLLAATLARPMAVVGAVVVAAAGAMGAGVAAAAPAPEPPREQALLAAADLRVGIERVAKLRLEAALGVTGTRAQQEFGKERIRIEGALAVLQGDPALPPRRRSQLDRLADDLAPLLRSGDAAGAAQRLDSGQLAGDLVRQTDALGAQLSFVATAVSAAGGDVQFGPMLDLLARAAAMAVRAGKLNLAAANGMTGKALEVDARQTLIEFRSALEAIGAHSLTDARMRDELELARLQWVLLANSLNADGLAKDARRLPHVATTADRIAQSLLAIAQRAVGLRLNAAPAAPARPALRLARS